MCWRWDCWLALDRSGALRVLPNGRTVSPSASYLIEPQVTKGLCSWLGPPSSGSLTPVLLRGPAPNGHPCPDGALAASMRLGPLRKTCVQPAPKSRLAVTVLFAQEDKSKSKSFPAEASPTGCTHRSVGAGLLANAVVLLGGWRLKKCFRQQAGSYRRPRRPGEIGACKTQSVRGGIPTRSVGTINSNSNSSNRNSDSKSVPAKANPTDARTAL